MVNPETPPPPPETDVGNETPSNATTGSTGEVPPKAQKKQPRSVWKKPVSNSDRSLTPANHAAAKIFENNQDILVIPTAWYHHLRVKTGPDDIAIALLAEIVYWFRPTADKKRKFKSDQLQKYISAFTGKFGYSRHQVSRALARLEAAGLITRELRNIPLRSGRSLGNVLFIDLNPGRLLEISTPPPTAKMHQGDDPSRKNPASHGASMSQPFAQECEKHYTQTGFPETAKTERTIPKPFPEGKGSQSFSPGRGRADWRSEAREDPMGPLVLELFPGDAQDWPEHLARTFVKRRRSGALPDKLIRLAHRCYRGKRDDEDPRKSWKAKTIREFLAPFRLDKMAAALTEDVRWEIQQTQAELDRWKADEYGMSYIKDILDRSRAPDFSFRFAVEDTPAFVLLACPKHPDAPEARVKYREKIEDNLIGSPKILEFCRLNAAKLPPFEEIFGCTEAEVLGWQAEYEQRRTKESNDWKSLL